MSEPYINFLCPVCSKNYSTSLKNAGQKRTCTECTYVMTIPVEHSQARGQDQHQQSTPKAHSNSGEQQPKLIDCPDCGTSISRLALACPKCGSPQAAVQEAAVKNAQEAVNKLKPFIVLFGAIVGATVCYILLYLERLKYR